MPITHVVAQGDCFSRIAMRYGFSDYRLLYDHPENAELKKRRPNPNVLRPGDRIQIPDRAAKEVDAEAGKHAATGKRHTFKVKLAEKALRLVLKAHDGRPIANAAYELDIGAKEPRKGATDGSGKLEEMIPAGLATATLTVQDRVLVLQLGHLNPLAEVKDGDYSGLQARLKNLGYDPGPADGIRGPRTRAAIALFQADEGLDITGEADDATIEKLEESHGS